MCFAFLVTAASVEQQQQPGVVREEAVEGSKATPAATPCDPTGTTQEKREAVTSSLDDISGHLQSEEEEGEEAVKTAPVKRLTTEKLVSWTSNIRWIPNVNRYLFFIYKLSHIG